MPRVLFVCLGNICRSPAAEAVFRELAKKSGHTFELDSAGTSDFHIGEQPDVRMIQRGKAHGYRLMHAARQVGPADFVRFDHLFAMDRKNQTALLRMAPAGTESKVHLFRSLDDAGSDPDVPDPYFGGEPGFDEVIAILERVGQRWLEKLTR